MTKKIQPKEQILLSNTLDPSMEGVSAAVFTDDNGYPFHAAIFVAKGNEKSIFHFDAENLEEAKMEDCQIFLYKKISTILSIEVGAFLVCCREAIANTSPGYQYYYNGGYFKKGGGFVGKAGEPSYHMTCVGFCLGVLKGWFEGEDYIAYQDWKASSTLSAKKIEEDLKELKSLYPHFTDDELLLNIRRIKPSEYLASAFISKYPVRKSDTDAIIPQISNTIKELHDSIT